MPSRLLLAALGFTWWGTVNLDGALDVVSVGALPSAINENGPPVPAFTISRAGDASQSLTVFYTLTGTAISGRDFARKPGWVTFTSGQTWASVEIAPLDDRAVEGPETVRLTLVPNVRSFSIVLLPDTQNYIADWFSYRTNIFRKQIDWILDNRDTHNITLVLHEGDCTENNRESEWRRFAEHFRLLDGVVPYVIAVGNHDGLNTSETQTALFNQFFRVDEFSETPTFGGVFEFERMDNSYHFLSAGGIDWLVLSLEFGPRDEVLAWANDVVSTHPNRRVIVVTHTHVYHDDTLHGSSPTHTHTPTSYGRRNNGTDVWEKFLRRHANIGFVFNGHVLGDGVGRLVGIGDHRNKVYQMLANYQTYAKGGYGWLRLVSFDLERDSVSVQTYSPYLNGYKTDPDNQFTYPNLGIFSVTNLGYYIDPSRSSSTVTIADDDVDTTPPTFARVRASGYAYEVVAEFSEPVDPATAQVPSNYAISGGVGVVDAVLLADQVSVLLTTTQPLRLEAEYTLTVNGVKDRATVPNTAPANTQATFRFSRVLLEDHFDDENLRRWTVVDEGSEAGPSIWLAPAGRLEQASNLYGPTSTNEIQRQGTFAFWSDPHALLWAHYNFSLVLNVPDDDGVGVLFRYQNSSNYYKVELDAQRNFRQLSRRVAGVETILAREPSAYTRDRDFALRVQADRDELRVWMDGTPLFGGVVRDGSLTNGTVALYSWGTEGVAFDDVLVTPINQPPLVTITSPADGASFVNETNVAIEIAASDPEDELGQVELYAGPALLASFSGPPYRFLWSNAPAGFHELLARALDLQDLSATSRVAGITVAFGPDPPFILAHPEDRAALAGDTVTFEVLAAGGEPLAYQWRAGEAPIPDATNATLALANVSPAQAHEYVALVTNASGAAISRPARLTVTPIVLNSVTYSAEGQVAFSINALPGRAYTIEASTNLTDWSPVAVVTNSTGALPFADAEAGRFGRRFYRVWPVR
jgi:hypothetical protein